MIMRRAVLILAALVVSGVMTAGAASAQTFENDDDYAALCIPLTLSSSSPEPGDSVTVSGTAASGGAPIFIVMNNSIILGETTSDPVNHSFSKTVTIPADAPAGPAVLQAFQIGDNTDPIVGCPASVAGITIVKPAEEILARTGSNDTLPLSRLGVGLVAAGGLLVLASRRRRTTLAPVSA